MSEPYYVSLPNRGLIHIEGDDRVVFLQGLITQDVHKATMDKILYGCLLTPQGKFLHDFFIHSGEDFLLLDYESGTRAQDLYERLNRFRLRSDVQISVEDSVPVYAGFGVKGLSDPRHDDMGVRLFEKPDDIPEKDFSAWDEHRIQCGVPDGSRDMKIEKSLLLECNIDKLNGVDFDKGCYMGQELTARMHYRNLGKKHLQTVTFDDTPPAPFEDIIIDGNKVGNMRSSCGSVGLAIIRDEYLESLKDDKNPIRLLG